MGNLEWMPRHLYSAFLYDLITCIHSLLITVYLVLQVLRLSLPVVALVNTPDKIMKVVMVEFLTAGFVH